MQHNERLFVEVKTTNPNEFEVVWDKEKYFTALDVMPMPIDAVVHNEETDIAVKMQVYVDIVSQKYYVPSVEAEADLL